MLKKLHFLFKYFGLSIISLSIFIIPGCNLNIFNYLPGFEIDSLYMIDTQRDYFIGDTLHLICETTHPENDSLTYVWDCNSGIIIPDGKNAKYVIQDYNILNINCKVMDEHNKWVKDILTLDFNDQILICGILTANYSQPDKLLGKVPLKVTVNDKYFFLESSIDGSFRFSARKPLDGIMLEINKYYLNMPSGVFDTLITIDDLIEIGHNEFKMIVNINAPSTQEYYSYIPLSVGNKWIYKSKYYIPDESITTYVEGIETWEVIEKDGDTLIFDICFQGGEYWIDQYTPEDTVLKKDIQSNTKYKIYKHNKFLSYISTLYKETNISNPFGVDFIPFGKYIFQKGLQFKFKTLDEAISYKIPDTSYPSWQIWIVDYGVGLSYAKYHQPYYGFGMDFYMKLLSRTINEK